MLLGKFSIINDEATGHRFVARDLNAENVTVLPRAAPATAGTYNFQWQMQKGATSFGALSTNVAVTVTAASGPPPTINTTSLPTGTKGVPYNAQISVSGGVAPFIFTVSSGALPAGVSLNRNTGVVSGVATVAGTFNFTVNVRDQAGATTSKAYKVAWR
jgi:hypothetical protein